MSSHKKGTPATGHTTGTETAQSTGEGKDEILETLEQADKVDKVLEETSATAVMGLAASIIEKLIGKYQQIINEQEESFNKMTQGTQNIPYIKEQLEGRKELIEIIVDANTKFCDALKGILVPIGTSAANIIENISPINSMVQVIEMINKIVEHSAKLNKLLQEKVEVLETPPVLDVGQGLANATQGATDAANAAAQGVADSAKKATEGVADAATKATEGATNAATEGVSDAAQPKIVPQHKTPEAKGGSNKKKNIHSLKKKHLFNQKTLKIRNRLHKLLR
jgi:hypothetical protein